MRRKFTLNDVFIIFYSFLIFNIGLTSILPKMIINALTIFTFVITILLVIGTNEIIYNKMNSFPFFLFLCYIFLTAISAYLNKGSLFATGTVSSTINYIMIMVTIFFGITIISALGKLRLFFIVIFFIELIYCLLNDIAFLPRYGAYIASQAYLLKGKFAVAYAHLDLLAFYFVNICVNNFKYNKAIVYTLIIFALIIDIFVDCITGIVGLVSFILFYFLCSKKLLKHPLSWLLLFIACSSVPFIYQNIVNSSIYQKFVLGTLNRGMTMNGRMNIYKQIPYLMYNHWHWGYGYGSSYAVVEGLISMPDMQNGFMELVVQVGLITTTIFTFFVLSVLREAKSINNTVVFPLLCLIYVYTILSSFEITFSIEFVFICIIIYVLSREKVTGNEILMERVRDKE